MRGPSEWRGMCVGQGNGRVTFLKHPQNLSFSKKRKKKLTPREPLRNHVFC